MGIVLCGFLMCLFAINRGISIKTQARQVASIYTQADYEKYSRDLECSQSLEFRVLTDDKQQTHLKLHSARFCRVRLCPVCQWRRSMMWRARFLKALPKICADLS
uniref:protein rep n=1 Tax=Microcystis aeruginosa TaxID=1126 RepID=UPI003AF00406